jgi:hypothetical protein
MDCLAREMDKAFLGWIVCSHESYWSRQPELNHR